MLNRRQCVCAAAAGAAALARVTDSLAAPARYDLIIKGGRVIDPSLRADAIGDVAIAGGRIAAVEANVAGDAAETLDARGKVVVPASWTSIRMPPASKMGPRCASRTA